MSGEDLFPLAQSFVDIILRYLAALFGGDYFYENLLFKKEENMIRQKKTEKGIFRKLMKFWFLPCLGLLFILLPVIFSAIFTDQEKAVWLGFWAGYIGGICTLIAVVATILYESSNVKKQSQELSNRIMQQFERDLDLKRLEKYEDSSISFKIFMLNIAPKFEEYDNRIIFNYYQIKNEMYEKYNLFKHCYYVINPNMDAKIKKYLQKTIKRYVKYLDQINSLHLTKISDAEDVLEKINNDYIENHAQKNKYSFIKLRNDLILYLQNKYKG